ncbi:hypothetical protein GF359_10455, partial [candidate division WOR-3 bacterium]|nr:hypothetical protein [candidate division WOR-3 bacterium]MBD3365622.1 hypothetical protein [candidate division WOR-3 bacterium]
MKRFAFLIPAVLSLIVFIPGKIHACPVGWEYVYEQGIPSAGFDFTHQGTHNVGVGAVYDEGMFFRHLLVVDISVWDVWPRDTIWTKVYDSILGEGRSIIKVADGYVIAGCFPEYSD